MFYKKGVLKNFVKFSGRVRYQAFFFNKVTGLRPAILLQKRLWHMSFPVKFLRTPPGDCLCIFKVLKAQICLTVA